LSDAEKIAVRGSEFAPSQRSASASDFGISCDPACSESERRAVLNDAASKRRLIRPETDITAAGVS
jgi:hypothetical protein